MKKKNLLKLLVIAMCTMFSFSAFTSYSLTTVEAASKKEKGVTKIVKNKSPIYGYKFTIYFNNSDTKKMIGSYKTVGVVISGATGFAPWIGKLITAPIGAAFQLESPYIKKANKGKGIKIPITVVKSGFLYIPYVHGYYAQ